MDEQTENPGLLERTTIDPEKDTVKLGAYVPPLKCDGCGGRVDTFYRYDRPDDAHCSGCGSEWVIE